MKWAVWRLSCSSDVRLPVLGGDLQGERIRLDVHPIGQRGMLLAEVLCARDVQSEVGRHVELVEQLPAAPEHASVGISQR